MPGFSINGINDANYASGESTMTNKVEPRRTHRWYFETIGLSPGNVVSLRGVSAWDKSIQVVLKSAARPSFTLEETVMHHNQEQVYFAGKQSWDAITLTWYDIEQPPDVSKAMWYWINSITNINAVQVHLPSLYKIDARLAMVTGEGAVNERWNLYGSWPQTSNWQALDYTNNEIQTIEVKLRYDRAERDQTVGVSK
jgi:hypothetical protein